MNIGEKIFYPMHGAGFVKDIEEKNINDVMERFYVIQIPYEQKLNIIVKEDTIENLHLRKLVDEETLNDVYDFLCEDSFPMPKKWSDRNKENMEKLKSLDIYDIAYVLKGLSLLNDKKKLSMSELSIYNIAKRILVSEFVMVSGFSFNKINKMIEFSIKQ